MRHQGPFGVLGLGRSGWETASFLKTNHKEFWVWDDQPWLQDKARDSGFPLSRSWVQGSELICSPGIGDHPLIQAAKEEGARVSNDIQLFFDFFPQTQAIGVTGTVGKSTTCSLLHHALTRQGLKSVLAGNIGCPIFTILPPDDGLLILELSSYQLERISHLPLRAAMLLNLSPHHLERHDTMEAYASLKKKIFDHAQVKLIIQDLLPLMPDAIPFEGGGTSHQINQRACRKLLEALNLDGSESVFEGFKPLAHRQEWIIKESITYCNDSKATCPQAVVMALKACMAQKIFWIAGGVVQNDDLSILIPHLKAIEAAYVMGPAATRYAELLRQNDIVVQCHEGLESAFHAARKAALNAKAPCFVLFSPGCASFDAFANFEERGETFRKLVHA